MDQVRRALVVGGGIGGLTAAVALAQRGIEVIVAERRPEFAVPGVGLGQPANALRVYDSIGVLDEVLAAGYIYRQMSVFDHDRELIASHRFLLGDERVPPVCALSRADLHRILRDACERAGVTIRLGAEVADLVQHPDRADVTLTDGAMLTVDVVLGFDGINSAMREHVVGTAFAPRHSGFGAWRLQVPRPDEVIGMEFLQGIGGKTGAMPLNDDVMYLFHIRPERADERFDQSRYHELLAERLSGYGGYVAEVRDALDADSDIVYSPIKPLLVPFPWHSGRVVIGGDAAHTFPPHLTQGAAMAVEDAHAVAVALAEQDAPLEERLSRYGRERYARNAFVYTFARQWLEDEQSITTPALLEEARAEMALNLSARISVSDRILDAPRFERSPMAEATR